MNNRELSSWKTVEASLRRLPMRLKEDVALDPSDTERWSHGLVLWALVLKDLWVDRQHSRRALTSWLRLVACEDVSSVILTLKTSQDLIRNTQDMGYTDRIIFKGWLNQKEKMILGPILPPLYQFADRPTADAFRKLNQALSFPQRITLQGTDSESAMSSYIATQEAMCELQLPTSLISDLQKISFGDWENFRLGTPSFNNGATNEVTRRQPLQDKFLCLSHTAATRLVFGDDFMPENRPIRSRNSIVLHVTAVPKDAVKKRLICPDDTTNIYYQSMISKGMERIFSHNPRWGINLRDQSLSQRLCLDSTKTRDYATIDMSEASDRVSWILVKQLLKSTTIYRYLVATRAKHYTFDKKGTETVENIHNFGCFAPMGARTCFPMECYIFSLVCRYAQVVQNSRRPFRVYGDDLIVPSDIYNTVLQVLETLGMKVNTEKTFAPGSLFLESCGMEAYDGVCVTPVRFPRQFDIVKLRKVARMSQARHSSQKRIISELNTSTSYAGAIEFHNALWCEYHDASQYVLSDIPAEIVSECHRCYGDESFGLRSSQPTNFNLQRRWNQNWQRDEIRSLSLATEARVIETYDTLDPFSKDAAMRRSLGDEECRYFMTLMAYACTERSSLIRPDDLISLKVGPSILRNKKYWREDRW